MHLKLPFITLSLIASYTIAQSSLEPPPGMFYLGAWLDTADSAPGAGDGDRPVLYNERMGFLSPFFHYAQDIPIRNSYPFPDEQVKYTGTDAMILMTLYPQTPETLADADIEALITQLRRLVNDEGRHIIVRFAPEMNGNWFPWSPKPTMFVNMWRRVVTAVRARVPGVLFSWAPNFGRGYPYGIPIPPVGDPDRNLLDTDRDGVLSHLDDPYAPYYPGDEYVDWVGMSVYQFGSAYPWLDNIETYPGYIDEIMNMYGFYQEYCVRRGKPLMIAEAAAAYHINTPYGEGVGEMGVKRTFWRQFMTNPQFFDRFPQVKMIGLFEFNKYEGYTYRDFRISTSNTIRTAFLEDMAAVRSRMVFANQTGPVVRNPPPPNGGTGSTGGSTRSSGPASIQRNPPTTSSATKTFATVIPVFLVTLYLLFFS